MLIFQMQHWQRFNSSHFSSHAVFTLKGWNVSDIQTHDYKLLWLDCPSYPDHVGHDMKNRLQQTQPCWRANFIGHAKCDRYLVLRCANPLKTKHEAKCVYCLLWTLRSVLTWVFLWGVCLLSMCLCTLSLGDCAFPSGPKHPIVAWTAVGHGVIQEEEIVSCVWLSETLQLCQCRNVAQYPPAYINCAMLGIMQRFPPK